jgi:glycerophosphoryl diester phosphodiesterase
LPPGRAIPIITVMPAALEEARTHGPGTRPLVIAHRGASGLAPENTLAAFALAVELGADGIELDVQLSADGVPVVIHDSRLNRTTNARGAVSRLTADQLRRLDASGWFERRLRRRPRLRAMARRLAGAGFPNGHVPTLEESLKFLEGSRLERIYVELKGGSPNRVQTLEAVLSAAQGSGLRRAITLLSFDHAIVRLAKDIDSGIRTAASFRATGRRLLSTRSIIRAAEEARADEVAVHVALVTRRAVNALHQWGFAVSVWTVNSSLGMRRMIGCGVDSIMTNYPNRLREVLEA